MTDLLTQLGLALMAFAAAVTNGAVGYGFSTLFTPVAVLFVTNRVLNPSLILVELGVNLLLLYRERGFLASTWRRAFPVILTVGPGAVLGTFALSVLDPLYVRLFLYALLLPFTLLQVLGIRRHLHHERHLAPVLGGAIGFLYALTTISGPPLAIFWNNQGLHKNEFRCTVAQIRVAESSFASLAYLAFGLFTPAAVGLAPLLLIPVLIGVPLGVYLLRSLSRVVFLRAIAVFDSGVIVYGLVTAAYKTSLGVPFVGLSDVQSETIFLALALTALATLAARILRNLPPHAWTDAPTPGPPGGGRPAPLPSEPDRSSRGPPSLPHP